MTTRNLSLVHSVDAAAVMPPCSTCHSSNTVAPDKGDRYHCGSCNMAFISLSAKPAIRVV